MIDTNDKRPKANTDLTPEQVEIARLKGQIAALQARPAFGKTKTECPVSRGEFMANAKAITVDIKVDGKVVTTLDLEPRQFTTGSFGWSGNGKALIPVAGHALSVQFSLNPAVANSKDVPKDATVDAVTAAIAARQ